MLYTTTKQRICLLALCWLSTYVAFSLYALVAPTFRAKQFPWWLCAAEIFPNATTENGGGHKGQDRTIQRMSHYIKLELLEGFSSVGSSMWTGIVMQQHNTF
jgi:hypothetical protein